MPDRTYKNFAFISYKREDSRIAGWLHRKLNWYRFPHKMVPQDRRPPNKRYVAPVVRDKNNLEVDPRPFWENIQKQLDNSRYLIVLCSRRSGQASKYVNDEISHFLNTPGRINALDHVVPVIIDGDPGSGDERECLPPVLRVSAIYNRNHPTMIPDESERESIAWERGLFATMSYLLGVDREKLRDEYQLQRRRQIQLWLGLACIVIALLAAAWLTAVEARRQADEQRERAVAARKQAENILQFLLYDLRDKLAPVGRLDIIRDVQQRVDRYYEELGVESGNFAQMTNQAVAFGNEGDRLFSEGKLPSALDAYQKSVQVVQRLIAADASNRSWQWFLSANRSRVGNLLLAQGDLAGALSAHRECLAIRQRLVTVEPSNMAWTQGVAASHNYIGDVMLHRGELADALHAYREALKIRQRLANAHPDFAALQLDLVDSLCKAAGVLERQLDADAAQIWRQAFEVLTEMKRRGMSLSPANEGVLESLKNEKLPKDWKR